MDSQEWRPALEKTREEMKRLNRTFADIGLDVEMADEFVDQRLDGLIVSLEDIMTLRTFGHFNPGSIFPPPVSFWPLSGRRTARTTPR